MLSRVLANSRKAPGACPRLQRVRMSKQRAKRLVLLSRVQANGRKGLGGCPRLQRVHVRKQSAKRLVLLSRVQANVRKATGRCPRLQRVLIANQSASVLSGPGGIPHMLRHQPRKQALSAPSHLKRALQCG